jgi:hypothetical protein
LSIIFDVFQTNQNLIAANNKDIVLLLKEASVIDEDSLEYIHSSSILLEKYANMIKLIFLSNNFDQFKEFIFEVS